VLAIVVMAAWPFRAESALGILVGVSLVASGLGLIAFGLTGDHPGQDPRQAGA
jgi:uncharacterized membrane protein HdeD (DUF308 family)